MESSEAVTNFMSLRDKLTWRTESLCARMSCRVTAQLSAQRVGWPPWQVDWDWGICDWQHGSGKEHPQGCEGCALHSVPGGGFQRPLPARMYV